MGEAEQAYVQEALASSWVSSTGKYIDRFESEFSKANQVSHCITTSNGTTALHLALLTLNVGPGDEVLVPSLTYIAAVNCITYVGATPIFVDVDPETWCMDTEDASSKVTDRTVGIIVVHLYGVPAELAALSELKKKHSLWMVEDAAEAHFAQYQGQPVGSFGDISTFSFYGNKIISCGEGGAVLTQSAELATRARLFRGQGMDPKRRYYFPVVGHNFRLTNLACALLCAQMERREGLVRARRKVTDRYLDILRTVEGVQLQRAPAEAVTAPWLFTFALESFKVRDELVCLLDELGIETRPIFIPVHQMPPYRGAEITLKHSESLGSRGLSLPTFPSLSEGEVSWIGETVVRFLERRQ